MELIESLKSIPKEKWLPLEQPNFPFVDHEFLKALEDSQSTGSTTGWYPIFLTEQINDQLAGAMVLYAKDNSYGEYIFDWQWADAYHRNGQDYFPKLVSAIPFTPATGKKVLINPQFPETPPTSFIDKSIEVLGANGFSSIHCLFVEKDEEPFYTHENWISRSSMQYHWLGKDYSTFDDFLASLEKKKRKQILRERKQFYENEGISVQVLTEDSLTEEVAERFFQYYLSTLDKKHAIQYLSCDFFKLVFDTMKDRTVVVEASLGGKPFAGSIAFYKGDTLFGRYFGTLAPCRHLHFELCYYKLIEFAIAKGLRKFEAGAQGSHKLARGFDPVITNSMHYMAHPQFSHAIRQFVAEEHKQVAALVEKEMEHSAYKKMCQASETVE